MDQYRSIYEAAGYPVYFISAREETGIEQVRSLLRGKTTVLAGPRAWENLLLPIRIQPEADMENRRYQPQDRAWKTYHPPFTAVFLWKKILI